MTTFHEALGLSTPSIDCAGHRAERSGPARSAPAPAAASAERPASAPPACPTPAHQRGALDVRLRDLETLWYSLSHDLRAPLRTLQGLIALLEPGDGPTLDPTAQHLLEPIRYAVRSMTQMLEDQREFARTESARMRR